MMNIWIVTIGSSDVQLDSKEQCKQKARKESKWSLKVWNNWYEDLYDIEFEPRQTYGDSSELYLIEPRVLGDVYNLYDENYKEVKQEIWSYLNFPLLECFSENLQKDPPDIIVTLLSDQTQFFDLNIVQQKCQSAYWRDTHNLKSILEKYFQEKFPLAALKWLILDPSGNRGLDDWDYVLKLVTQKFEEIKWDEDGSGLETIKNVYVSHQAGTPAISSALQFAALAKFRNKVQFLVCNEETKTVDRISKSNYLKALKAQEIKALLKRHDYSGVFDILGIRNQESMTQTEKQIKHLLKAAEQWNQAEFKKFFKLLVRCNFLAIDEFPWYQSGYESAYLAWVRLKQGNTVEALFHSFRAMEGTITIWAKNCYPSHIREDSQYGPQLQYSLVSELPSYLGALSESEKKKMAKYNEIGLYGDVLYKLLKQSRRDWEVNPHIKVVWEAAKKKRNNLFHRIEGLQKQEVFKAWETENEEDWIQRLLGCLNFVVKEDFSEGFESLKQASIIAKVHEALEKEIENL